MNGIIHRASEKTGKQVVVLIDEYDAPLLEVLHEDETLDAKRMVMQEFFIPLKANERTLGMVCPGSQAYYSDLGMVCPESQA